jgi:peptidoglycan/LPS O-acetylase OafA/YrhL
LYKSKRLISLDIIRVAAILLILISHLEDYSEYISYSKYWTPISVYSKILGLGLFLFISGYSLAYKKYNFTSIKDINYFYRVRFIRIFPLYFIALFVFFVGFIFYSLMVKSIHQPIFSISSWIIHLFGMQVLLSPRFVTPFVTLWFIGLITLLYIIYPIILFNTIKCRDIFFRSLFILFIFYLIHIQFNLIDNRFFILYIPFIAGVLFNYASAQKPFSRSFEIFISFMSFVITFFIFYKWFNYKETDPLNITSIFLMNCLIISISIASILLINLSGIDLREGYWKKIIIACATASYCVYLFHRPYLGMLEFISEYLQIHGLTFDLLFVSLGFCTMFYLCYIIQTNYDKIAKKFKNNFKISGKHFSSNRIN